MFKVTGIDHIGIAVPELDSVQELFEDVLGIESHGKETVADQKVTTAFYPLGDSELEFLESTAPDGPIAKYIDKNGGRGGIQHVALRVDNLEAALADLKERGIRLIDEKPRRGAGGNNIAFLHPKATNGILVELCQKAE
ncbi:MAG: methylmalonyl-CoA epimerase [Tissierellia bacterium]|nr:methylmalonyl-CoA epimerase [Tissierellia bacterium]